MTIGTRRVWGVSVTPRPFFTPEKDPVPIVQKAGWAPGPVWTGAEKLAPTEIRSSDRPARSQSLYRLRYPAQWKRSRYCIFRVSVCSLSHPANKAHVPYCWLWYVCSYHIFPRYFINGTIFGKKGTERTKCFDFLNSFCLKHFSFYGEFSEISA
jgi:hypothetical protein